MFSPQKEELKRERAFQDSMGKDGVPGSGYLRWMSWWVNPL
jgi:hypothetical protein